MRQLLQRILMAGLLLLTCHVSLAEESVLPLGEDVNNHIASCTELLEQIRKSDCTAPIADFLAGGNLSIGASMVAFKVDVSDDEVGTLGRLGGDNSWSPHYAVNSRPTYFGDSDFGYEYSFAFESSATTRQTVQRSGLKSRDLDLGTYAIGSILAAQANLFYAWGGHDTTPNQYLLTAFGLGIGYGSVRGHAYLTEDKSNTTCFDAGTDFLNEDPTARSRITQNCALTSFDRAGIGASIRILLLARYEQLMAKLDLSLVGLNNGGTLVSGKSEYNLAPSVTSVTLAYLFDVF